MAFGLNDFSHLLAGITTRNILRAADYEPGWIGRSDASNLSACGRVKAVLIHQCIKFSFVQHFPLLPATTYRDNMNFPQDKTSQDLPHDVVSD